MSVAAARHVDVGVERECPACGGRRFRDWHIAHGLSMHTCQSCGLILSSLLRRYAKMGQYENVDLPAYMSSVGAVRDEQSLKILSIVRPHAREGARVLDIGCGFGSFLQRARQAGYAVAGVEPDAHACAGACDALGAGVVRHGTLQQVKLASESADVVSTLDVLEHVPLADHEAFAHAIADVLAPGGIWVIKVPSTDGLYYHASAMMARVLPRVGAVFMHRLWQTDYEWPHMVYFNRSTLQAWLQRHGFTVVGSTYLPEVPLRTIIDRLSHDGDISRWQAYLLVPAVLIINAVEWLRRRSDALVVIARRR
jgi:2-polyprenyl-3-methyl-5-hydroxy-6-metoxy-1,4-benzoquinol methylase